MAKWNLIAIVVTLFFVSSSYAYTPLGKLRCDGCTTSQYQSMAFNIIRDTGSREGYYNVVVIDTINERIQSYNIIQTYEPGLPEFMVFSASVAPSLVTEFNYAMNVK